MSVVTIVVGTLCTGDVEGESVGVKPHVFHDTPCRTTVDSLMWNLMVKGMGLDTVLPSNKLFRVTPKIVATLRQELNTFSNVLPNAWYHRLERLATMIGVALSDAKTPAWILIIDEGSYDGV